MAQNQTCHRNHKQPLVVTNTPSILESFHSLLVLWQGNKNEVVWKQMSIMREYNNTISVTNDYFHFPLMYQFFILINQLLTNKISASKILIDRF